MIKRSRIIIALIFTVVIVSIPFLYNAWKSQKEPIINLDTPAIRQLEVKECIESTEYMKANHMKLLYQWREEGVREGKTEYTNKKGNVYKLSFQTCLNCHYNPGVARSEQFCISCHDYNGVKPNCWECHKLTDPHAQSDVK